MRAPIQAIAFDLWNTLVGSVRPVNPMQRLLDSVRAAGGDDAARLVAECTMTRPLPGIAAAVAALEERLGRRLARGEERARLLASWREGAAASVVFEDVEPALRRLAGRYRIGVISNTQSFDMEFWERSAARALLDVQVLSYEEGSLKPAASLFARFARAVGVRPQGILMVGDNSQDDIRGALEAGFQAVRVMRPAGALSHREERGSDLPLSGLAELDRRLAELSAAASRSRAASGPSGARRRGAAASRKKRR